MGSMAPPQRPQFPMQGPNGETFVDETHMVNTLGAAGAIALLHGQVATLNDPTLTPEANAAQQAEADRIAAEDAEKKKKALTAIYGAAFPLVDDDADDADWVQWAEERWDHHRAGVQNNIFVAERNRLFRAGVQWLSRNGSVGQWREPPMPKDAVRIVDNQIRPSLAWALQIISEQRPGWQFQPSTTDPERQRKAEAQQLGVEYQYDAQGMRRKIIEAGYWAQTDGVSFGMTFWNADKGPWEELESGKGPVPMGEPDTKIYRIEQVRVSAEATSTQPPMYWLVRDILPKAQAVALYGPEVADENDTSLLSAQASQFTTTNQYAYAPLYQDQDTVPRFTIFCEKSEHLPQGLSVIICGKKVVFSPKGLPMGAVPMVRFTDGSEDPAFYPTPTMNELIAPQMRINMLLSKWFESIRVNAGGRFLTKTGALVTETLIGGQLSAIEVRGAGPLPDTIQPVQGFSIGEDVKEALQREIKAVESRSGWNDTARGSFTADQSGRAILAIREQLERTFAPFVGAISEAMTEWAKQQVGWMKWGYAMPRMISVVGTNRPDLARALSSDDFDGIVDVRVDPETLMPMPRALRLWLLEDALQKGVIDMREYKRRAPFGFVNDMGTTDDVQEAKGKRVAEAIRTGQPAEPVIPQDNEALQMDILVSEILLAAGMDPQVQQVAQQRFQQLEQQMKSKQAPPPPDPNSPAGNWQKFINVITSDVNTFASQLVAKAVEGIALAPAPGALPNAPMPGAIAAPQPPQHHVGGSGRPKGSGKKGSPMDPRSAPIFGSNPSVAASPQTPGPGGQSSQDMAAHVFERTSPE